MKMVVVCLRVDEGGVGMSVCSESGRSALMEADGIHLLYNTCLDTIDCRELEAVIYLASIIMRKCFPKSRLPLATLRNPLTFPIRHSDICGSMSTELTEGTIAVNCLSFSMLTGCYVKKWNIM